MLVILALRRLRQEDLEFGASLSYMARTCLQKERKKKKRVNLRSIIGRLVRQLFSF
jgi:hypothetical protein